jgi:hypothetical protein
VRKRAKIVIEMMMRDSFDKSFLHENYLVKINSFFSPLSQFEMISKTAFKSSQK